MKKTIIFVFVLILALMLCGTVFATDDALNSSKTTLTKAPTTRNVSTTYIGETSSILVHVLTQEGVEVASIQGMPNDCVKIYDNNKFIGNSAYNLATHPRIFNLQPGTHLIKSTFNGVSQEQIINLNEGEIKTIVFIIAPTTLQPLDIYKTGIKDTNLNTIKILNTSSRYIDTGSSDAYRNHGKFYYEVSPSNFQGTVVPVVRSNSGKILYQLPSLTAKDTGYFYWDGKINGKLVNPADNPYFITLQLKDTANKLVANSNSYLFKVQPTLKLSLSYFPTTVWMPGVSHLPRLFYRISVTNNDPNTINNVMVTDLPSNYLKYVLYSFDLNNWVRWTGSKTITTINPRQTKRIYLVGTLAPIVNNKYVMINSVINRASISCRSITYYNSKNNEKVETEVKWMPRLTPIITPDKVEFPSNKPFKGDKPDDWEPPDEKTYWSIYYYLTHPIVIYFPTPKP